MLGAVLESALHDHIYVELHSFPPANGNYNYKQRNFQSRVIME